MSSYYYYLCASLPILTFDGESPFTCDEFLDNCRRNVAFSDFAVIESAVLGLQDLKSTGNELLDKWYEFDHALRNQMASIRAAQLGKDPAEHLRGSPAANPAIVELLNQASKTANLLKAEQLVDEARWEYLNEIGSWHILDLDFLIVYGLKLKILERYRVVKHSVEGKEKFKTYQELKIEV